MDRKAFKLRMQNLKSYRDNNPGKGYWDWKLQSYDNGGTVDSITLESSKLPKRDIEFLNGYFDRQKVYNRVPAREWAPAHMTDRLVSGPLSALYYYNFGNNNTALKYVDLAKLIINSPEYKNRPDRINDAVAYLAHEDAKDFYLGMPLRTGLIEESLYLPSNSNQDITYYRFKHQTPEYWGNKVIPDLLLNKVYNQSNTKRYKDKTLSNFKGSLGVDPQKGEYASIYDIWDYNTNVKDNPGDNVGKYIGGSPFEIYDRVYLDDLYGVSSAPDKGDYYGGYLPEIEVIGKRPKKFADGGETDHPTYRPEILENVEMTDPVTGKSWSSMSTEEQASLRRARSRNPYSGKQIARGNMEVISPEFDIISGIRGATNLSKHLLNDYKLRFPYAGNPNKAFRLVNPDAIDDYLKTGVVGPESKIHNVARSDKRGVFQLTKHFDNHVMFNKLKPFYGIDSKYERLLVGDLDNPRILWNKVSHKGHKGIVDPVNTITEDFTVPVSEFDIWKKLPIGWWRQLTAKSYADGGEINSKIIDTLDPSKVKDSKGISLKLTIENLHNKFPNEPESSLKPIIDNEREWYDYLITEGSGYVDAGLIPEVTVKPDLIYTYLDTYYPVTSKLYKYTGHSKLSHDGRCIDKGGKNKGYNLVTNNCADATLGALLLISGKKANPFLFTTPGDVRDFALEKLSGEVILDRKGQTRVRIPINAAQSKKLREYIISGKALREFADGGEIPPSRKTGAWSNERGEEGIVTTDSNKKKKK